MKTYWIEVYVKDPDEIGDLIRELGLSAEVAAAHFDGGEYATFCLKLDENLRVVDGYVV